MPKRALLVSASIIIAAVSSFAQFASQGTYTTAGFSGSTNFGPPPPFSPPLVTGAPYSGEEVSENVKVLTDGTRITQQMALRKVWRDSQGRTRTERSLAMGPPQASASIPVIVEITDPIAGFRYTLDTQNKVAHRQALPAPGARPTGMMGATVGGGPGAVVFRDGPAAIPAGGGAGVGVGGGGRMSAMVAAPPVVDNQPRMQPRFSREPLGSQNIDGVMAEGTRNTTTYPVGMMGNDREFSVVSENWMSPELKIQILSKSNDPRSGENTFRIRNLSQALPDATLFMPPADFTVVDEAGSFTINFK